MHNLFVFKISHSLSGNIDLNFNGEGHIMELFNPFQISSNAILLLEAAAKKDNFVTLHRSSAYMLQVSDSPSATEYEDIGAFLEPSFWLLHL